MVLTNKDLDNIVSIVDKKFDERFTEFKVEIFEEMDNNLQSLKSDLFERIDPVLKEVVTAREERPLLENRLEALEEIHQEGSHSLPQ